MKQSTAMLSALAATGLAFVLGMRLGGIDGAPAELHHGEPAARRLTEILQTPDVIARASALAAFFSQANPDDAEHFRDVLRSNRRHVGEVEEVLLASWWARTHPGDALAGRTSQLHGGRDHWVEAVVREWTLRDPRGALAAVMGGEIAPKSKGAALRTLVRNWFGAEGADPSDLLVLFRGVDDNTRIRGEAIALLVGSMLEARGPAETTRFAESVSEDNRALRREFLGRLAGALARVDIELALGLVERHGDERYQLVMERYLANDWGQVDGPAALQWAAALESPNQPGTVKRVWRSFVRTDRVAAFAFMRDQQPGPGLEPAYALFLAALSVQEPETALDLLSNLHDERDRNSVLKGVGMKKFQADPEAAERWMDESDLAPELRQAIVEGAQRLPRQ